MKKCPENILSDWLCRNKVKRIEFARLIEVHRSAVTYYLQGKRRPIKRIADKIETATDGYVPANIWAAAA